MDKRRSPVDFVVAGFSKCGTTTLHELLSRHADILMTGTKDVRFHEQTAEEIRESFDTWRRKRTLEKLFGTTSIWLTSSPCDIDRMVEIFPDAKLVFIARDPVGRIESSFREFHHSGATYGVECPYEFGAALKQLPQILADSDYEAWLNAYRERCGPAFVHIVFLEDLKKHPRSTLARCFEFLGVDPDVEIPDRGIRMNAGSRKYYDDRRLRKMRNTLRSPSTGIPLSKLPRVVQDQFLPHLGLRLPFDREPIDWQPEDEQYVLKSLAGGVTRFLEQHGKSIDFWPRFAGMLLRHG